MCLLGVRSVLSSPGSLVGVGDVIAQQAIERRGLAHHNVQRTAKMMSVGFFFVVSAFMSTKQTCDGAAGASSFYIYTSYFLFHVY